MNNIHIRTITASSMLYIVTGCIILIYTILAAVTTSNYVLLTNEDPTSKDKITYPQYKNYVIGLLVGTFVSTILIYCVNSIGPSFIFNGLFNIKIDNRPYIFLQILIFILFFICPLGLSAGVLGANQENNSLLLTNLIFIFLNILYLYFCLVAYFVV